jgi:DNA-binding transcriptional LysR family regulator
MAIPEIRLLQAAIALAEDLNFTRAAERLHIGQSTLSKQICELEGQLGFRLFERNHQRVDLTDAGRVFVEEAREAVLRAERAVLAAKATFSGADEILNIGKSPHGDPYLVSTLLSIHLPLFPGLRVKLWSDYSNELAHQVIAGTLDLALITGVPNNPKLSVLRVADDPLYVAMIADDDLAVNREVYLSCIHNRNWIFLGRQASPYLYDTFQIVASDLHREPNRRLVAVPRFRRLGCPFVESAHDLHELASQQDDRTPQYEGNAVEYEMLARTRYLKHSYLHDGVYIRCEISNRQKAHY